MPQAKQRLSIKQTRTGYWSVQRDSVPTLEAALVRCAAQGAMAITLDLGGLAFIDSAGLWIITSARSWCDRRGCGFSLVPGPASVHRVFELTGLSDVLPFRPSAAPETWPAADLPDESPLSDRQRAPASTSP